MNPGWARILSSWRQAAAVVCVLLAPWAHAQPSGSPDGAALTPEAMVADMLARRSIETVAAPEGREVAEAEHRAAGMLLDRAVEVRPDDAELWRLRAYQARTTGETDRFTEALTRYVQLRPEDDAALLDLLLQRVNEVDTVDGRLSRLEGLLRQGTGLTLSDPARSRLASLAAVYADQLGEDVKFGRYLKMAVQADPSNGEAAELTYRLAQDRGARPLLVAAASLGLVRAKPLDPASRLRLAFALSEVGLFGTSSEQFGLADRLSPAGSLPVEAYAAWARGLIASGRDGAAAELLDGVEQMFAQAAPAESGAAAAADGGGGEGGGGAAGGRPLPVEFELYRRVLWGRTPEGEAALERAKGQLHGRSDAGDADAGLELAWVLGLFDGDIEKVSELIKDQPQDDPRYARAAGFVYLRDGAERWARASFERVADTDAVAAYGLATMQGVDDAGRARFLGEVVRKFPSTFGGLLAARALLDSDRSVPPNDDARAITEAMNRLPVSLWRLDLDRNPWTGVRLRFVEARTDYLEPIRATVTVSNTSGIALTLAADGSVRPTAVLDLGAYSGGTPLGRLPAIVADLGRTLTLRPGQRLEVPVRVDRSIFGLLLATQVPNTITYNAAVVLDPRVMPNGSTVSGPLGGFDTARSIQAVVPPADAAAVERWITEATDADAVTRYKALARLASQGDGFADTNLDRGLVRRAEAAVNEAYLAGDELGRAWVLLMLNAEDTGRSPFRPMLDEAKRSDAALVRTAYLVAVVDDPQDAALATAIRDGSAEVSRFAEAWRGVLEARAGDARASGGN